MCKNPCIQKLCAPVAQGIEQRFPKPLVGSSILPRGATLVSTNV